MGTAMCLAVCSGQPAAYRHPRTMEPYATIEAYKTLQRRYEEAQAAKAAAAQQHALLTQRQGAVVGPDRFMTTAHCSWTSSV